MKEALKLALADFTCICVWVYFALWSYPLVMQINLDFHLLNG